jgi:Ca2+-binding RTX toxin-like protein
MAEIIGDNENNVLQGTENADFIYGLTGNDTIYGGGGDDVIHTFYRILVEQPRLAYPGRVLQSVIPTFSEYLQPLPDPYTNPEGDTAYGGAGNDQINGGIGHDDLVGGTGDDEIIAGSGDDWLTGADDNTLFRSKDADLLVGGGGNDFYFIDQFDTIVEEADQGEDMVVVMNAAYSGKQFKKAYSIQDNIESAGLGGKNITTLFGNDESNRLVGNDIANKIYGGGGSDTIEGRGGNDTIICVSGANTAYGESGNDAIRGGKNNDVLYGGEGRDIINWSSGYDAMWGGGGNVFGDNERDLFHFTGSPTNLGDMSVIMDFDDGIDKVVIDRSAGKVTFGDLSFAEKLIYTPMDRDYDSYMPSIAVTVISKGSTVLGAVQFLDPVDFQASDFLF